MRITRVPAVLAAAAVPVLLTATPAFAHVTVHGPEASQGGFAKLTFQVPTEKDIPTTKLEIDFPVAQPLAFVSVKPHTGWTITVTKSKLAKPIQAEGAKISEAVSKIVWTASPGQGIKPGYFDEFDVSAGFLPKAPTMVFKALQTYSDGSIVRWIEAARANGAQPDHPAPVLHLASAAGAQTASDHTGMTAGMSAGSPSATPPVSSEPSATPTAAPSTSLAASSSAGDTTAKALGGTGLAVGLFGLVLGGTALARTGRH